MGATTRRVRAAAIVALASAVLGEAMLPWACGGSLLDGARDAECESAVTNRGAYSSSAFVLRETLPPMLLLVKGAQL